MSEDHIKILCYFYRQKPTKIMKKLLLLVSFLVATSLAFSTGEKYKYEIAIESVTDYPSAKTVTDLLREKFESAPLFDDDNDVFVINTDTDVSESDLMIALNEASHTLIKYKKTEL